LNNPGWAALHAIVLLRTLLMRCLEIPESLGVVPQEDVIRAELALIHIL
jgi:hypothetical protein